MFRMVESLLSFRWFGPVATRLELAQRAEQRFDFAFVGEFLALGVLDEFQNFFHLFQRLLKRFDDLQHSIDSLADGGTIRAWDARRVNGSFISVARRQRRAGWL
jgi:hypothetical protein